MMLSCALGLLVTAIAESRSKLQKYNDVMIGWRANFHLRLTLPLATV